MLMKFQLPIEAKMLKNSLFLLSNSQMLFIMLINVKMPTNYWHFNISMIIVGILTFTRMINTPNCILTFMSMIMSCSFELSMKIFIPSEPGQISCLGFGEEICLYSHCFRNC